jgi:hypothetical protein
VWPGNTNDMSVLQEVKDDLRWRLGRVVTVLDRGFSSDENLRYLTRGAGTGSPANACATAHGRAGRAVAPGPLPDRSRQPPSQEVHVGDGDGDGAKRFVVCHNPAEADRDKQARDDTIARLRAELVRITAARARANSAQASAAHHRAECALRDHTTLGRYVRQTKTGRLLIDRAKIKAEQRLDGSTCSPPQIPICRPKTSHWATRTCSKPNAASATSKAPLNYVPSFTAPNGASVRTPCSAGWPSC